MKHVLRIFKLVGCAYGGGVLAAMIFGAFILIVYSPRDIHLVEIMDRWKTVVWISGAAFGGWVAYRSDRYCRNKEQGMRCASHEACPK